jgi:hypothetical protein
MFFNIIGKILKLWHGCGENSHTYTAASALKDTKKSDDFNVTVNTPKIVSC